jgi:hypothetical protein
MSCAFGIRWDNVNELIVGTIMSLLPFTTSVGWPMRFSSAKRSPLHPDKVLVP